LDENGVHALVVARRILCGGFFDVECFWKLRKNVGGDFNDKLLVLAGTAAT
jgi:hypothetical protein